MSEEKNPQQRFTGKKYVLRVNVNSQIFSYTGSVTDFSNDLLTFKDDKTGRSFTFTKHNVISLEELE